MLLRISPPCTMRSGQQMRLTQSVQQELLDLTVADDAQQPANAVLPRRTSSVAEPASSGGSGAHAVKEHAVTIADQLAWQQQEVSKLTCVRMRSHV